MRNQPPPNGDYKSQAQLHANPLVIVEIRGVTATTIKEKQDLNQKLNLLNKNRFLVGRVVSYKVTMLLSRSSL